MRAAGVRAEGPGPDNKNKILVLMVVSMVLSYLPWYNFSAVLTYIAEEFNLSGSDTGTILAVFQVGQAALMAGGKK